MKLSLPSRNNANALFCASREVVDPSHPSIAIAQGHAMRHGLVIRYQVGTGEHLDFANASFDIVSCCDVLEHVSDLEKVISEIARVLKEDGVFFYDTINRTLRSQIISIQLLQEWKATSVMPPHLHDWKMFIKPQELRVLLHKYNLMPHEMIGLVPSTNPLALLAFLVILLIP